MSGKLTSGICAKLDCSGTSLRNLAQIELNYVEIPTSTIGLNFRSNLIENAIKVDCLPLFLTLFATPMTEVFQPFPICG